MIKVIHIGRIPDVRPLVEFVDSGQIGHLYRYVEIITG